MRHDQEAQRGLRELIDTARRSGVNLSTQGLGEEWETLGYGDDTKILNGSQYKFTVNHPTLGSFDPDADSVPWVLRWTGDCPGGQPCGRRRCRAR